MPSYKNLAITALAASFVSPTLSAPIGSSQKQSRAEVASHPLFLFPMVTAPAPGGSSKRTADAPESRAVAELEGRGAVPIGKPVSVSLTKVFNPGLSAGAGALLVGGATALAGGLGAFGMHEYDKAHSAPAGGNSKRGVPTPEVVAVLNALNQRDVPSPEVVAVLNALNQRADIPSPEVVAVLNALNQRADYIPEDEPPGLLVRALNELD